MGTEIELADQAADLLSDFQEPTEFYVTYPHDDGSEAYALTRRARVAEQTHNEEDALALADQAIAKAKSTNAQNMEVWALCIRSSALTTVGMFKEALSAAAQAAQIAEKLEDKVLQARANFAIAKVSLGSKDLQKGFGFLRRSLAFAEDTESAFDLFWTLNSLSWVYGYRAEQLSPTASEQKRKRVLTRHLKTAERALKVANEIGAATPRSFALLNFANAYFIHEEYDTARRLLAQCASLARESGAIRIQAYATIDESGYYKREGRHAEAIALIKTADCLEDPAQGDDIRLLAQETLAQLYHQIGDFEAAFGHLEKARGIEAKMLTFNSDRHLSILTVEMNMREARAKAERYALEAQALEMRNKILEQQQEILRQTATEDALTGLGNRRAADAAFQEQIAESLETGKGFQVIFLDADHFKQVNDTFGHQVGDQVLTAIGKILRDATRATDSLFRFGGEEFVLIIRESRSELGMETSDRLRKKIMAHNWAAITDGLSVTASFGVASWAGETEADSLLERADKALYAAKENGRNRVEVG